MSDDRLCFIFNIICCHGSRKSFIFFGDTDKIEKQDAMGSTHTALMDYTHTRTHTHTYIYIYTHRAEQT